MNKQPMDKQAMHSHATETVDLQAFLVEAHIERRVLETWIERHWIVLEGNTAGARDLSALTQIDAARARFIRDLTGDFGVNDEGIDIVLHLVDQLHGLRRMLSEVRAELDARATD